MQTNDLINSGFKAGGAIFCWTNVQRILRDREVKGVYWPATAFFAVFGIWNLWFYPSLGQWCSFWAGAVLASANCTWVALALWYGRHQS